MSNNYNNLSILQEEFKYYPKFIPSEFCDDFCANADELFPTHRDKCMVYGKKHTIPRDQVVMGRGYRYSGHKVKIVDWTAEVQNIKYMLEDLPETKEYNLHFDTVLINGYNGEDKVGWHSDDESTLDTNKPIISVSFGATRDFDVRLISEKNKKWRLSLGNGDVVIMMPKVQKKYQHQVPPRKNAGRRYNLTFRVYKK